MVEILKTKSNEVTPSSLSMDPWEIHGLKAHKPMLPLPQDTLTILEDEDEMIKKISALPLLTSIPQLTHPDQLNSKDSAFKKLDAIAEGSSRLSKSEESDFAIDREVFERIHALRTSHDEMAASTFNEIRLKQNHRKELQLQLDELQKSIISRTKTSKVLDWVQAGTTVALVALSATCFALTIATGGVSAVLGVLTAAAAAGSGVVGGVNGAIRLETEKKQGQAIEIRELRTLEFEKVHGLLADNQAVLQKIHDLWSLSIQILRNQSRVKFN